MKEFNGKNWALRQSRLHGQGRGPVIERLFWRLQAQNEMGGYPPSGGIGMINTQHPRSLKKEMEDQLHSQYQKNLDHLKVPATRQRIGVSKMRTFLFILGFILSIALVFGVGYLMGYAAHPKGVTYAVLPPQSVTPSEARGQSQVVGNETGYRARAQTLQSRNLDTLIDRAEWNAKEQTKQAARNVVSRTLSEWSYKIRQTFGEFFGSAVLPLTTGLARSAVDAALPVKRYEPHDQNPLKQGATAFQNGYEQEGMASKSSKNDIDPEPMGQNQPLTNTTREPVGKFSLQVHSFSSSDEALALAQDLAGKQLGAYVVRIEQGNQMHFAVRIGQFKTFKESQEASHVLKNNYNLLARVVTIHPFQERLS